MTSTSKSTVAGTTLSSTEFQREVKESVLPVVFQMGISNLECVQIDSYKWILKTLVQGVPAYAELSLTAKKADFGDEELSLLEGKYAEKLAKANDRETSRAAKRAEKASAVPRNSSGNLDASSVDENGNYIPYAERYANDDF